MRKGTLLIAIVMSFVLLLSPARGATAINSCQDINAAGDYYLSADIDYAGGSYYCININNDDVILDLNGHYINRSSEGFIVYLGMTDTSLDNITIRNGTLRVHMTGSEWGGSNIVSKYAGGSYYSNITLANLTLNATGHTAGWCIRVEGDVGTPDLVISNVNCSNLNTAPGSYTAYGIQWDNTYGNVDYATINDFEALSNASIAGHWTPIYAGSRTSYIYACGLRYDGTIGDLGLSNYFTKDTCEEAEPRRWWFTPMVFSADEMYNNSKACWLNLYDATVTFAGQTKTNATDISSSMTCEKFGDPDIIFPYTLYGHNFTNVLEGIYTLTVEKVGYTTQSVDILLDGNIAYNVLLQRPVSADLEINIGNSTDEYVDHANTVTTLYYSNGSMFMATSIRNTNPQISSQPRWWSIPFEQYYFVIDSRGHESHVSPVFTLSKDMVMNVTLTATDIVLDLSVDKTGGTSHDTFNFTLALTGLSVPRFDGYYHIRYADGTGETYRFYVMTNPYNITLRDFGEGVNCVWVILGEHMSNTVCVEISDEFGGGGPETPMVDWGDVNPAIGWIGLFFTPFSIMFGALIGISVGLEQAVRSNGAVFFGVVLIGGLALTYLGLFPLWIGIGIAIICAFMLAKFSLGLMG